MESRALRWETLAALSSSSKGRLSYGRRWPHDEVGAAGDPRAAAVPLCTHRVWVAEVGSVTGPGGGTLTPASSTAPRA